MMKALLLALALVVAGVAAQDSFSSDFVSGDGMCPPASPYALSRAVTDER